MLQTVNLSCTSRAEKLQAFGALAIKKDLKFTESLECSMPVLSGVAEMATNKMYITK